MFFENQSMPHSGLFSFPYYFQELPYQLRPDLLFLYFFVDNLFVPIVEGSVGLKGLNFFH